MEVPRPLPRPVAPIASAAVLGAGALALAAALALTAAGSPLVWAVPAVVGGGLVVALAPGTPLARLTAVLLGGAVLLGTAEGLQVSEVLYGLVMVFYLGGWYASRWLGGQPLLLSATDIAMALWLTVGIGGAAGLGLVFGANPTDYRNEILAAVPFYFYFPAKEACSRSERGLVAVAGVFVALGFYATVANGLALQSRVVEATALYEVADARFTTGESYMGLGMLLAVALGIGAQRRAAQVAWLGAAGVLLGGLILTRTRSFWISCILGLAVMLVVATRDERRRTLVFLGGGLLALLVVALVQFREQVMLLLLGTVGRAASLGSVGTDISLLARLAEYRGLWDRIAANPLLGYGWGVPYSHYSFFSSGTRTWSFTHNGWLSVWYKSGLWGLALMGFAWLSAAWAAAAAARSRRLTRTDRALGAALVGSIAAYALAANAANPFLSQELVLSVTLLLAMAAGLGQRRAATPSLAVEP